MDGWPYTTFPTGWFQVEWSKGVLAGEVKTVHFFDQDLVVYRTGSGRVVVVDAHCPHMGAHLGRGGCVVEENLRCPWHGWQWSPDGRNAEIAFVDMTHPKARLTQWATRELDGLIVVWYDALGREPLWEFPGVPEYSDVAGFYEPFTAVLGPAVMNPQQPRENTADLYHFPFVHGSNAPAALSAVEKREHVLFELMELELGGGKASTWLTPNGPVQATIETHLYGLGLGVDRFHIDAELEIVQVVAVTPVNQTESVLLSSAAGTRVPGTEVPSGRAKRMMESQHLQIANDFEVWANQKYVQKPLYAPQEGRYFNRVRSWAHQFYPADHFVYTENETSA